MVLWYGIMVWYYNMVLQYGIMVSNGSLPKNGLSEILTVEQVLNSVVEHLYWLSCQDLQLYESSYTVSTELIAE